MGFFRIAADNEVAVKVVMLKTRTAEAYRESAT